MSFTAVLLLLVSSPVDSPAAPDAEPVHAGRPLAVWLADLDGDDKARHEAMRAVAKIGPTASAAVPRLIAQLKAPQPKEAKFPLDIDAAQALEAIGPAGKEAVPALLARMKQAHTRGYCLTAADAVVALEGPRVEATWGLLAEFNPTCGAASLFVSRSAKSHPAETVRHLIELTRDENPLIREYAIDILGLQTRQLPAVAVQPADLFKAAGEATKDVPAAVERALGDKNPHVRLAATRAHLTLSPDRAEAIIPAVVSALNEGGFRPLKKAYQPGDEFARLLRPVAAKAFEPMLPLLEHKTPHLREEAIWTLARLPVQAQLEKALKEEKSAVRRAGVAAALGHGDFPTAVPALTAALRDADADVRFRAAVALVERTRGGSGAAAAVPALVEGLRETDPEALGLALRSLRALRTVGAPATGRLKELTRHAKLETRVDVAVTLAAVNPREPAALPPLVEALGPGYRFYRGSVYEALGNLGPLAKPALPELEKQLDRGYTVQAARAIFRIDPDGPGEKKAIIALTNMADRYEEPVRLLRELRNKGKAVVPFLLERMSDPKTANGGAAVAILALDPASGDLALRWLRQKLTTGDEKDVSAILAQLWQLGEGGRVLVPELVGLLKSRSDDIREAAVDALGEIGPAARDALPALRALAASDPSPKVRRSAATAVRLVGGK
jgi:HEAT repeat protein